MHAMRFALDTMASLLLALALALAGGGCAGPPRTQTSEFLGTWKLANLSAPQAVAPQGVTLGLYQSRICLHNRLFVFNGMKTLITAQYQWAYTNGAMHFDLTDWVYATNRSMKVSARGKVQGKDLIFEHDPFIAPFTYASRYERLAPKEARRIWSDWPMADFSVANTNRAEWTWRQRVDAVIAAEANGEAPPKRKVTWAEYWKERTGNIDALRREGWLAPRLGPPSMLDGMGDYIKERRKASGLPPFD